MEVKGSGNTEKQSKNEFAEVLLDTAHKGEVVPTA
jgi:hypothetical protein